MNVTNWYGIKVLIIHDFVWFLWFSRSLDFLNNKYLLWLKYNWRKIEDSIEENHFTQTLSHNLMIMHYHITFGVRTESKKVNDGIWCISKNSYDDSLCLFMYQKIVSFTSSFLKDAIVLLVLLWNCTIPLWHPNVSMLPGD